MIKHSKILVLGTGPAGCTAAIYLARANLYTTLITGPIPGGQLISTSGIENWPGDYPSVKGIILMERMINHTKNLKINLINDTIIKVNLLKKPFLLIGNNASYTCEALIIATGASPKYLGLPLEKELLGKGISFCATCDGFFFRNKNVAVIGGGNTAVEEALYLANIAKKVFIIHRRNIFKAEKILINRLKDKSINSKIDIKFSFFLKKIYGNKEQGLTGIKIQSLENSKNIINLSLDGLFIAIGHEPNTNIFKDQISLTKNKYIKIGIDKKYTTSTNIKGIFAAGDVHDFKYRQAITSSGFGCMAALDVQKYFNK